MSTLRATLKVLAFFVGTFFIAGAQCVIMLFHKGHYAYVLPRYFHKMTSLVFGIQAKVIGAPIQGHQLLYASNHISYLDIPLMGGLIKQVSFVAKKDVASWPLFGFLSKLQQTAFIDRSRSAAAKETSALSTKLANGKDLIIFPEGTSTDGKEVLPFKSSLFSIFVADDAPPIMIQPILLEIESVDGKAPDNTDIRNTYAWPREVDTPLATHLWRFAKSSGAVIRVIYGTPVNAKDFNDRKALAKACHDAVCNGERLTNAA